jgi:hypothetical protein
MTLSLSERLTMLMPPSVFYRRRIAQEACTGEPELAVLAELVPRGGIAVDIGANVGFFAYALADIADRVFAFEPNPDYAFFARWMFARSRRGARACALRGVRPWDLIRNRHQGPSIMGIRRRGGTIFRATLPSM